eukprot:6773726-Alexandrium_andersonii.AAC.1
MSSASSGIFFARCASSGPVLLAPPLAQPRNDTTTSPDSEVYTTSTTVTVALFCGATPSNTRCQADGNTS